MTEFGAATARAHIVQHLIALTEKKLSPQEVSGWAADNGLRGRLSPFREPFWTLPFTTLWAAWRDQEVIERHWLDLLYHQRSFWSMPMRDGQLQAIGDAEDETWRSLQTGRLKATGVFSDGERREVSALMWMDLVWSPIASFDGLVRKGKPEEVFLSDCRVDRDAVLNLWPDIRSEPSPAHIGAIPAETKSVDTGGRPPRIDDWHNMWIEVCRILQTEKTPPADHLAMRKRIQTWFAETGRNVPADPTLTPIFKRLFRALNG